MDGASCSLIMNITYTKSLPVKMEVDIFIAGGGPAGIAAAVTAARAGCSVFAAEMFGAFGGAASQALVPAFMQFSDGVNFLAGGFGQEVRDYIKENAPEAARPYCPDGIPVETLKLCYDHMAVESGVRFSFFTSVIDVIQENGRCTHAVCAAKGETFAVKASYFIDCTGDGDLCVLAGASFKKGSETGEMMAATLCGLWSNIDWSRVIPPDSRALEQAFTDGVFTNEDRHLPGMWRISKGLGGSNAGHVYDVDGSLSDSLTQAMLKGRRQLLEYRSYYRGYLCGYEETELVISASYPGIRETRRIDGDYELCLDDFFSRAVFDDEIGRYAYPIDIHAGRNTKEGFDEYEKKFTQLRYEDGESYGIPYRSLLVRGLDNVLTAGRCICTDRSMESSVRVMPGCFITGQAAGMAAALAAKQKTSLRGFSVKHLQSALKAIGAFLPNCE